MVAPFKPYSKEIKTYRYWLTPNNALWKLTTSLFTATGVKQAKPYVDTAYDAIERKALSGVDNNVAFTSFTLPIGTAGVEAVNKAYGKLTESIGEASQLGSTLTTEGKATYNTVVGGAVTLLQSARAVRKGQLVKAARLLGVAPPERIVLKTKLVRGRPVTKKVKVLQLPTGREVLSSAGGKWLWWSYGIQPMVGDMHNALDVLQRPLPWERFHGYASASGEFRSGDLHVSYKSRVKLSVNVRVANPNLFLMSQLGLVNPVQMINEGIPFSFVVDWFSNLSQVISHLTDFVGLEIDKPVTSEKHTAIETWSGAWPKQTSHKRVRRQLVLAKPKLLFKYERFNWQRGANAISLLLVLLPKK